MCNRFPSSDVGPLILLRFISELITAGQLRASLGPSHQTVGKNHSMNSFCWTLHVECRLHEIVFFEVDGNFRLV